MRRPLKKPKLQLWDTKLDEIGRTPALPGKSARLFPQVALDIDDKAAMPGLDQAEKSRQHHARGLAGSGGAHDGRA